MNQILKIGLKEGLIKDIRYFEEKPMNYNGIFDGIIGNIYKNTFDTNYIGQRIARKLNELGFVSGEFTHIYINFTENLQEDEICESSVLLDKQLKYFNYGLNILKFNKLTDFEKDSKIKEITFSVLYWIYKEDEFRLNLIKKVEEFIGKYDKLLMIRFKIKETSQYKIDLSYQIRPTDNMSKLYINYTDKKNNSSKIILREIFDYQDLYSIIDRIILKEGKIIFQPKKSYYADLIAAKYNSQDLQIDVR
jgi:hypothetical protein